MKCPSCNKSTQCKDSRDVEGKRERRYLCSCGMTTKTVESVIETYPGRKAPGKPKIVRLEPNQREPREKIVADNSIPINDTEEIMKVAMSKLHIERRSTKPKKENNVVQMGRRGRSSPEEKDIDDNEIYVKDNKSSIPETLTRADLRKNIEARRKLEDRKLDKELFFQDEFEYPDDANEET